VVSEPILKMVRGFFIKDKVRVIESSTGSYKFFMPQT